MFGHTLRTFARKMGLIDFNLLPQPSILSNFVNISQGYWTTLNFLPYIKPTLVANVQIYIYFKV